MSQFVRADDRFSARANKMIIAATFVPTPMLLANSLGGLFAAIYSIKELSAGNRVLGIAVSVRDVIVIFSFIFSWVSIKKA